MATNRWARALGALLTSTMLAMGPSPANAASPQDRPFTVANYPVEATAKNAVAAKSKAIEDGQQAAFGSLLKRIVPVTAYNRMEKLRAINASEYLEGFAVRSEQNSATDYIASLDFSFQADAVRDLLRREGVPYIDVQAQRAVLVPVQRTAASADGTAGGEATFAAASGTWSSVWQGLDLENTVTPIKLEPLRPAINADALKKLLDGDGSGLRAVAGEYKSETIVVAVAEPDTAARKLHVTLAGYDATGPINWRRSYRIADGDLNYAMELAAVISLGVVEGRWKAARAGAAGGVDAIAGSGADIAIEVAFQSIEEWNEIRGRLLDLPGIDDLSIGAVSARSAEVSLKYPGGPGLLANELAPHGLTLRNAGSVWQLRSSY